MIASIPEKKNLMYRYKFFSGFNSKMFHYSLTKLTHECENHGEEGGGRERDGRVVLQHLQQLHDEDKNLMLTIPEQD